MENKIELKSISELLGMNFFIPSYQRGYRWDKQQVIDLLDDIYAFANKKSKSEQEFYCLQPIVVKKCTQEEIALNALSSELDDNQWYEVIDGQQRLTTLRILISFIVKSLYSGDTLFKRHKKHPFSLEYETRKDTREFLENIVPSTESIDLYYISEAYTTIEAWFNHNPAIDDPQQAKEAIRNTLIYSKQGQKQDGIVEIIWYQIQDTINPIDTFIRINMGKIPLTNAELIKALFLQKKNFGDKDDAAIELRQLEIANEWDRMEYALQKDDFWSFLNKGRNDIPARIEFLFDTICNVARDKSKKDEKKAEKSFSEKYGTDNHTTFRYFNALLTETGTDFEGVKDNWNYIKSYFLAFEEWFNNPIWYHYIGYLIYCGEKVTDIYDIYNGNTKDRFTQNLKQRIKDQELAYTKKENQSIIDLSYDNPKDKYKIRQLLLLFNIQFIVKEHEVLAGNNKQDYDFFIQKFPFELFKKEEWDIEHIDSQKPNDKETIEWLKVAKADLEEELKDEELLAAIDEYTAREKTDTDEATAAFDKIYKQLSPLEIENDNDLKNSVGNLTLLNADINRSYGNALFSQKRKVIIQKDMEGRFIPICTKHVFLKYFDKQGTTRTKWTKEDICNYQNYICETIKDFLTLKPASNE